MISKEELYNLYLEVHGPADGCKASCGVMQFNEQWCYEERLFDIMIGAWCIPGISERNFYFRGESMQHCIDLAYQMLMEIGPYRANENDL